MRDFRTFFGVSAASIGGAVSWQEAWFLINSLSQESGSHWGAVRSGWNRAATEEAIMLTLLTNLYVSANSPSKGKGSKPKLAPLPWETPEEPETRGVAVDGEEAQQALKKLGWGF